MRTTDLIFSAVYLIALAIAASQISQLSDTTSTVVSSHLFPWVVLGTGLVMGGLETVRTVVAGNPAGAPTFRQVWEHAFKWRRLLLFVLFVVYLLAITTVGFMPATAVFCFATIILLSPKRSLREVILAAVITGATIYLIYLLLVVYLQAFLP
ncbi:tripartite tricarboxylate transporter TctB family protein [Amorphus sp. 3PC139-8]|uniref:tripartite tricarboxylate transporter TctB family protein n=1 Tax=Amorphus sp. 3PC139-8 TaxID=2735676 RepID=UPI00345CCE2D